MSKVFNIAVVGLGQIEGKRIEDLLEDRTLPHFHKFRNDPLARGFVKDSYASGLSPPAFWFHAMAGRIGMIDTAISTAEVGYITRRFIKATEDLEVKYDNIQKYIAHQSRLLHLLGKLDGDLFGQAKKA